MERIGVRLKCSRGDFVLRSTFGCLLADEEGIEECLSLKGASGSKPCCFCRDVLGRAEFFDDHPYFVHVGSTDVTKFDLHTHASFAELCTVLASEVSEGSSKARVAEVERVFGIKYDKHAVAFCPAASKVAMLPESVFPDTMHNMLASGGVLQYELNQLTRRITRLGFRVGRFCRSCKTNEAWGSAAAEKLLCRADHRQRRQQSQSICG
jgi:hypothetical protein